MIGVALSRLRPLESWVYPLTDSSYDSLENELDTIGGGSPGFCGRRPLRLQALQSSLDSILTFNDYDQDADTEALPTKSEGLRGVRVHLAERRRRPKAAAEDASSAFDSLSLEGGHAQRRRSEPAIAYAARFCPYISGSDDGLAAEDEERHASTQTCTRRGNEPAALGASSSPTHSTLDSLGAETTKSDPLSIPPPSPFASGSARTPGEHPGRPKDPAAKDPHHWGALKGCMGLHPNSWLKKDRRLSLTQQEGPNIEDDDKTGVSGTNSSYLIQIKMIGQFHVSYNNLN